MLRDKKNLYKFGYRKYFFDTDVSSFIYKRIDEPNNRGHLRIDVQYCTRIRNRCSKNYFIDNNWINVNSVEFKIK